jgi:hypothetical protein
MIKLIDLLNEDNFQSEEPSSFSNEQEVIQDYINELPSEGTTMSDVMEDAKDYPHAFQLRLLMRIAKDGLLNLSNSNIKVKPEGVLQMFNTQSDIAYNALANYNLNEKAPCWKGYKQIGMKEKGGREVPNCVPLNELSPTSVGVPEFLAHAKQQQYPYLQFPSFEDLKEYVLDAMPEEWDELKAEAGLNEAFFIGEGQDIKCKKCGWEWKLDDGGTDPYICHKCGHDNEVDEYDVDENNINEVKDFIKFLKKYFTILTEANCDCVYEAEYHGRKVSLGKPMQGDIKKFKVYVKNSKGKVVKVNFGQKGMNIKKNNPKRRKAYRARHNCNNPGPRTKANYWSCRKW